MKTILTACTAGKVSTFFVALLLFAAQFARAQEMLTEKPQLVTNPPLMGTFFLLQNPKSPPYPFDPFHGELPVYFYDGVYFVDDTGVDYVSLREAAACPRCRSLLRASATRTVAA